MKISHSGYLKYKSCPYSYYLQYVEGIKDIYDSVNLAFGSVIHEVYAEYLFSLVLGKTYDAETSFKEKWQETTETVVINYTSGNFTPEDVPRVGQYFAAEFPAHWESTGYTVYEDGLGPFIERSFSVSLNGNDILRGRIDLGVVTPNNEFTVLDFKFVGAESQQWFPKESPQLKTYKILVDESSTDGSKVQRLGFYENIKRKVPKKKGDSLGPQICTPITSPAYSEQVLSNHKQALSWSIEDIKKGRFPKTPGGSFNTPCMLCNFQKYCYDGNKEGLVFPDKKQTSFM